MHADSSSLVATVILLFPMLYFLLSSLTFLLARLSDPIVTGLLRALFSTYFLAVAGGCTLAVVAFAAAERPWVAAGLAAVGLCALCMRHWFLRRLDAWILARDAGDVTALRGLRRLHVGAMLYNAGQIAMVVASIPSVRAG